MIKYRSLLLIIPFSILLLFQCSSKKDNSNKKIVSSENWGKKIEKINGVSFVSPPNEFDSTLIGIPNEKVAANWLCFMPFGFIRTESRQIEFNSHRQWWGERTDGVFKMIKMAQNQNYKTMLKPQIWIKHGKFTGHHKYDNEEDWLAFESSYSKFILEYARMADSLKTELFCIGTELDQFIIHRPTYWKKLIQEVRSIYSGKITYAANWDEYLRIPFWNQLDYIGIDGYFPLNDSKSPTIKTLRKAWQSHKKPIKYYADSLKTPILFTEYGFRSRDYSSSKPWESDRGGIINHKIQSNAYQALFEELWGEDYFAGGFLWKWFPDYDNVGGLENSGFTPQRKPAEKIIKKYYQNN